MGEVITLERYKPPRRTDGIPWTDALIQEAATVDGSYATIDTVALDPVDDDAAAPAYRTLTTEEGTAPGLWYRIKFRDATGDLSQATEPVQNLATSAHETAVGLTTLAALRLHVLREEDDSSADEKLIMYGEAMSERVADFCAREFLPDPASDDDDPVSRTFAYDGSGSLDLRPYDLREVEAITLYSDRAAGSQQTLTTDQYRLRPSGRAKGGTYLSLDLVLPTLTPLYAGFEWEVTIEGRWGMAAVPKAIELAVWVAVDNVMKNPGSWASQQLGGYIVQPDVPLTYEQDPRGGLPRDSVYACVPYRRKKRIGSVALRHPSPGTASAWSSNRV